VRRKLYFNDCDIVEGDSLAWTLPVLHAPTYRSRNRTWTRITRELKNQPGHHFDLERRAPYSSRDMHSGYAGSTHPRFHVLRAQLHKGYLCVSSNISCHFISCTSD